MPLQPFPKHGGLLALPDKADNATHKSFLLFFSAVGLYKIIQNLEFSTVLWIFFRFLWIFTLLPGKNFRAIMD